MNRVIAVLALFLFSCGSEFYVVQDFTTSDNVPMPDMTELQMPDMIENDLMLPFPMCDIDPGILIFICKLGPSRLPITAPQLKGYVCANCGSSIVCMLKMVEGYVVCVNDCSKCR
jgi:hypothetical protein